MKNSLLCLIVTLFVSATATLAQPPERPRDRPARPRPPREAADRDRDAPRGPVGLFAILDGNGDRTLDADEIANAAESLAELDKNADGSITFDEVRPSHAAGNRRSGGRFADEGGPRGDRDRPRHDRHRFPRQEGFDPDRFNGPAPEFDRRRGVPMVDHFMEFDADDDGKLSADELPERMLRFMERADANEDGYVDRPELEQLRMFIERFGDRQGPEGRHRSHRRRPDRPDRPDRPERPSRPDSPDDEA